ncbi:MAG: hypothetical protein IJO32_07170 [Bacilli bacterium]|nr:hypothetical protein [Bacilli bacterium]
MEIKTKYNDKNVKLDTDNLQSIGSGYESKVYSYNDIAIKIHRDNYITKTGLPYNSVKKFKKIETERILMPQNFVYETSNMFPKYKGYTTKLITNIKNKAEITNVDSNHLYQEINKLKSDIKILSSNKILIYDILFEENLVFNDNIYFVDPGSFYYDKNLTVDQVYNNNMKELNFILYYYLFCLFDKLEYIEYELKNMKNINKNYIISHDVEELVGVSSFIYKQKFKNDFTKNPMKYINNIIKILEKYESIKNYKYIALKNYVENAKNNSKSVKMIKKIIY